MKSYTFIEIMAFFFYFFSLKEKRQKEKKGENPATNISEGEERSYRRPHVQPNIVVE